MNRDINDPVRPGDLVRSREAEAAGYRLTYSLYRSAFSVDGEHIYSLSVRIRDLFSEETAFAYDVSRQRGRALRLFELVSRGLVTPCTLYDVLEDLL